MPRGYGAQASLIVHLTEILQGPTSALDQVFFLKKKNCIRNCNKVRCRGPQDEQESHFVSCFCFSYHVSIHLSDGLSLQARNFGC